MCYSVGASEGSKYNNIDGSIGKYHWNENTEIYWNLWMDLNLGLMKELIYII